MGKNYGKDKITKQMQDVAIDILSDLLMTKTMDDVIKVYNNAMKKYDLSEDPFTHFPCTFETACKNSLELEKQKMIERYGHCDGLE